MTRHHQLSRANRCLLLFASVLFTFTLARAQSATATLSGTVEDTNGAVVTGANVTVTNEATRLTRQATTNKEGGFVITLLPPIRYTETDQAQDCAPLRAPVSC